MNAELVKRQDRWDLYGEDGSKIASSSPNPMGKLSIKNCQAIELGYDLDELTESEYGQRFDEDGDEVWDSGKLHWAQHGFKAGFQKALEILGDKKFSEKQLKHNMLQLFYLEKNEYEAEAFFRERQLAFIENSIQSLQQTEWDVIVEMEQLATFTSMPKEGEKRLSEKPKLDSDGNLILKRI